MRGRRGWRALRNAFGSYGFRCFGPSFAADYLRFAARCAGQWGYEGPGRLRLLGATLEYPNQSHALFLLHDVFVAGVYRFRSRSRAPRVVDCGANVGFSVLFFKRLHPGARIIAFEPEPRTCAWLRRNVERNGLTDVEIRQAAIAAREGTVSLLSAAGEGGSIVASTEEWWGTGEPIDVPAVRLSPVLEEPVDFLKMDIEGAEHAVLAELTASGAIDRVAEMVVEVHHRDRTSTGDSVAAMLRSAGMSAIVHPGADGSTSLVRARRL